MTSSGDSVMQVTVEQALQMARRHQWEGRLPEAEDLLRRILAHSPNRPDVANELAMLIGQQNRLPEAEAFLQRLVQTWPAYVPAWHNLAVAAERQGHLTRAADYLRHARDLAPDHADTYYRLGQILKRLGLVDEALAMARRALELNPDDSEALGAISNYLLLTGQFAEGWKAYEARWRCNSFPDERRPWSTLDVEKDDLQGKRVALYGEQGYGDMIQFARYATLLARRGAHVTTVTPPDVAPVMRWISGVSEALSTKSTVPADYLLPMMSLPGAFHTSLDTIPAQIPYLHPPADLLEKWRQRLAPYPGFKIGIAWAGRPTHKQDRERSVRLDRFAPLARIPGITLFSLQKGPAAAEANPPPAGLQVVNLTAGLADFADTAGLLANLDLVLSVDTAVVHLAGALGKEVWTLLAAVPDWRWLLNRPDSPWYPTMRLFRQREPGQWDSVFAEVETALRQRLGS